MNSHPAIMPTARTIRKAVKRSSGFPSGDFTARSARRTPRNPSGRIAISAGAFATNAASRHAPAEIATTRSLRRRDSSSLSGAGRREKPGVTRREQDGPDPQELRQVRRQRGPAQPLRLERVRARIGVEEKERDDQESDPRDPSQSASAGEGRRRPPVVRNRQVQTRRIAHRRQVPVVGRPGGAREEREEKEGPGLAEEVGHLPGGRQRLRGNLQIAVRRHERGDVEGERGEMRMQVRVEEREERELVDRVSRGDDAGGVPVVEVLREGGVPGVQGADQVPGEDRADPGPDCPRPAGRRRGAAPGRPPP